jgi:prepilin-type N-terminal cleavage/methylation domain-containing protein
MPKARSGFTLVELIVVLAISGIFASFAIVYSTVSRNAIALSVQSVQLGQIILQAKSLSIATYTADGSASCGFGVVIDKASQTFSIFSYSPVTLPERCPQASSITSLNSDYEKKYTDGTWHVPMTQGVVADMPNNQIAILFYPPDPTVFLSDDGSALQTGTLHITLATVDGKSSSTISVNAQGQVSF